MFLILGLHHHLDGVQYERATSWGLWGAVEVHYTRLGSCPTSVSVRWARGGRQGGRIPPNLRIWDMGPRVLGYIFIDDGISGTCILHPALVRGC